ncbi:MULTISPECIES: PhoH family protein [Synechocystis]|uniref:PhoH-like protein n=1 Tax=Synechocystis salina LEGE 00031 TaxID=1828736 RepID=A0ABR9VW08_9SYNC|nr:MULTISPECIES: PhoH family protein [Synechocystis]MBE9194934.1 PhoH family protein [Synechocystis sp. LEGE 06083]MBE9241643.1 PhoH family protein [Synechocystis salina LEGE 00041]MBE9255537.1 PhoH family protein [Synechocystis salina LEGE 00031]
MSQTTATLQLPSPDSAIALAGSGEDNLTYLAHHTGAKLILRGQELMVVGTEKAVARVMAVLQALAPYWQNAKAISRPDLMTAFHALDTGKQEEYQALQKTVLAKTRRGEIVRAKTFRQRQYIKAIQKHDVTFCIGPAGTGKTFLAAVLAVQALLNNECDRLILTRPAVEAGEKLGFLPGDLQQKVDPFLRPLYDALYEFIEPEKIPDLMERGKIEVAPLAYMRGRTLTNAFVIVDEAQNTTPAQLKMVLTRLGFGSKMIVTGDVTQTDLPNHQKSGLQVAQTILKDVEGVAFCYLNQADVVRHPLVQRIVEAYERSENAGPPTPKFSA